MPRGKKGEPSQKAESGNPKMVEGLITATTTVFGKTTAKQQTIEVRPFETTPAEVSVSVGRTINLGNYEPGRIDVSVKIPVYREEILADKGQRIIGELYDLAAEYVGHEVDEIEKSISQGN